MNLLTGGLAGQIIPINPSHTVVCGLPCFPSVEMVATPIDLAVIAVPAPSGTRSDPVLPPLDILQPPSSSLLALRNRGPKG